MRNSISRQVMRAVSAARAESFAPFVRLLGGSAGLRMTGMFFGFLVGVQLARGLGPAGYGVYGAAMAVLSILMIPTEFGLPQLVTREVAATLVDRELGSTKFIIAWARRRILVSSAVIGMGTICFLFLAPISINNSVREAVFIGIFWIPVVALGNIYGATLRGLHDVVLGQLGEFLIRPMLVSLFVFLLVFAFGISLTSSAAMILNIVAASLGAGATVYILRRKLSFQKQCSSVCLVPKGLSFKHALPMAMSDGLRVLASQIGILILALSVTEAAVGKYRVAYQIYAVATMPSALINIACAPMISSLFSEGRLAELRRTNLIISFFLIITSAITLAMHLAFGGYIIELVFGNRYREAAGLLSIFLVGEIVVSLFGHPIVALNMTRRSHVVMLWSAVSLLITAVLVWALVPSLGGAGAAIGTSLGLIGWSAGCAVHAKIKFGMDTSPVTLFLKHKVQ